MRNVNNHTRVSISRIHFKKSIGGSCRLYSALQRKFAERLDNDGEVESFETNHVLENLSIDGVYTSDFLVKYNDGTTKVFECVFRRHILKPQTVKLLTMSRNYWLSRGVKWGIVTEADNDGTI